MQPNSPFLRLNNIKQAETGRAILEYGIKIIKRQ